jgi:formylmethanofuran dehydrogenase subunit E
MINFRIPAQAATAIARLVDLYKRFITKKLKKINAIRKRIENKRLFSFAAYPSFRKSAPTPVFENPECCDECGKLYEADTLQECKDSRMLCPECLEKAYKKCPHCGEYIHEDDTTYIRPDDVYVCRDCLNDHYTVCSSCGEYVCNDDVDYYGGSAYCQSCYDEDFTTCQDCGEAISRDNACYDDDDNGPYCYGCYDSRDDRDGRFHCHGSDLTVRFHDGRSGIHHEPLEGTMYYGMELEMEAPENDRNDVIEAIADNSENDWYLEEDGSLDNGIEVIAHARTFESWRGFWKTYDVNVLKMAGKYGCKAHDSGTCGIHIHTSLEAWDSEQLFRLFSIIYSPANYANILTISQRKESALNQWASLRICDIGIFKDDEDTDGDDIQNYKERIEDKKNPFGSRYAALNITSRTLEFRLFNSNLRIERVRKNMEFVHALYCYTKGETRNASWHGLVSWIVRNKGDVENLYAFCVEKGIIAMESAVLEMAA